MTATVRAMTTADVASVAAMMRALDAEGAEADPRYRLHPGADGHYEKLCHDEWMGIFSPYPIAWVAEDGGQVVGFIQGSTLRPDPMIEAPPTVHIRRVYVAPSHRRTGLGRHLVSAFTDAAEAAGFPRISVTTLGLDARAQSFWTALGFGALRLILCRETPSNAAS